MRKSREDRGGGRQESQEEGGKQAGIKDMSPRHKHTCSYIGLWARDSLSDRKALVVLRAGSIAFT